MQTLYGNTSSETSAVMFQVQVFWAVTPCSVVLGYQHFGGPCCLRLHEELRNSRINCLYNTNK